MSGFTLDLYSLSQAIPPPNPLHPTAQQLPPLSALFSQRAWQQSMPQPPAAASRFGFPYTLPQETPALWTQSDTRIFQAPAFSPQLTPLQNPPLNSSLSPSQTKLTVPERFSQPKRREEHADPRAVKILKKTSQFTSEDHEKLIGLVENQPLETLDWNEIAAQMKSKAAICKERYCELKIPSKEPVCSFWTEEEDEKLKQGVQKCKSNWKEISALYFRGKRTANECVSRWQHELNPLISKEEWSLEEQMQLEICIRKNGYQLHALYEHFKGIRTPLYLQEKLTQFKNDQKNAPKHNSAHTSQEGNQEGNPKKRPLINSVGLFPPELEAQLIKIVEEQDLATFTWGKVAKRLGQFTSKVVRDRYVFICSNIRPSQTDWTQEEDQKLTEGVKKCSQVWEDISALYFKGKRSRDQCLARWRDEINPGLRKDPWSEQEQQKLEEFLSQPRQGRYRINQVYKLFGETRSHPVLEEKMASLKKGQKAVRYYEKYNEADDQTLLDTIQKYSPDELDWGQLEQENINGKRYRFFILKKRGLELLLAKNPPSQDPWSQADIQKLKHAIEKRGEHWEDIAALYFQGSRSPSDCLSCWKNLQAAWSSEILERIRLAIYSPEVERPTWESLAKASSLKIEDFQHRYKQALFTFCYLDRKWTETEDTALKEYLTNEPSPDPDWLLMALRLFPFKRNPADCKKRAAELTLATETPS